MAKAQEAETAVISVKIEEEVAQLESEDEKREFLETLGLEETGLARVVRAGYKILDLITFFTAGPKETRAWTIQDGALAPQAAGVIHTDLNAVSSARKPRPMTITSPWAANKAPGTRKAASGGRTTKSKTAM